MLLFLFFLLYKFVFKVYSCFPYIHIWNPPQAAVKLFKLQGMHLFQTFFLAINVYIFGGYFICTVVIAQRLMNEMVF